MRYWPHAVTVAALIVLIAVLTSCTAQPPDSPHPRMQTYGMLQPSCVIFCGAKLENVNSEAGATTTLTRNVTNPATPTVGAMKK